MLPLSPPEAITPSSLTESELTMQLWPVMLCRNLPSGLSHFFMLSADACHIRTIEKHQLGRVRTGAG